MQAKGPFKLQSHNLNLLRNVLNEVLHGIALRDVAGMIGMSANELAEFLKRVQDVSEGTQIELSLSQTIAFRNALQETLRELGIEEFRTRTGYSFEEGNQILERLRKATIATGT